MGERRRERLHTALIANLRPGVGGKGYGGGAIRRSSAREKKQKQKTLCKLLFLL